MGLSWCLAQFCSSCCEREHEATARDTAAGQAGLAGCPAEILSPASPIHPPVYTAAGKPNILLPEGKTQQLHSLHLLLLVLCIVVWLFAGCQAPSSVRLFIQVIMSVKERVGGDEALQSVNFPQRLLTPTASASPETGNVGPQRAQQPRASGACHRLPRDGHAARWVHTVTLVAWGTLGSVPSGVPRISKQEGKSIGCKIALTHVRGS